MTGRHRYHLLLFLVLVAAVTALAGVSVLQKAESFVSLGFEAAPLGNDRWEITAVSKPGIGLLEGDVLLEVAGTADLRSRDGLSLMVMRNGEPVRVAYQPPVPDIEWSFLALAALGLVYLLIGLYTALKERLERGRLLAFWCLASAALYLISPVSLPSEWLGKALFVSDQTARLLLAPLTLHLFLVFPGGAGRLRLARLAPVLYLPSLCLLLWHLDQIFWQGKLLGGGLASLKALQRLDQVEIYLLVLFSLLGSLALFARLERQEDPARRQRMALIAIGLAAAYGALLVLHLLPRSLGIWLPDWTQVPVVLLLGLAPLTLAYFILRHHVSELGLVLRASISLSVVVVLGVAGFAVINLLLERHLTGDSPLRSLLTVTAGLGMAATLVPVRSALSGGIERFQHRRYYSQRRALVELGREILQERSVEGLCRSLVDRQLEGLGLDRAALYLLKEQDRLALFREQGIGKLGHGVSHDERGRAPQLLPNAGLMAGVISAPVEIELSQLEADLWQREVKGLSGLEGADGEPTVERALFQAGYRYAFPLLVEAGGQTRVIGLFLAGYKVEGYRLGGLPLDSEDLDLARGLLNQGALAIENAQLLAAERQRLRQVRRLEQDNRGILEASPAGLALVDDGGTILSANRAFLRITSTRWEQAEGADLVDVLPVQPLPRPEDGLIPVSYCEPSGRERYLELSVAWDERDRQGASGRRVLVVHDVSERRALEHSLQEKERLASLGMMAAGVAHEVNTPLTGISSYAQMLLSDTDASDPQYELLKKMERQTFRASEIVNSLLDFARNRREELAPLCLADLLVESVEALEERATEASVELRLRAAARPCRVLGISRELHQVFTNLMVNALQAMAPRGGGHLWVELEMAANRARVEVRDDGPGIPEERLDRIFQPFFSSRLGKGGTGLGLAITYQIVRRHGGELRAMNHGERSGCTFTVELPMADSGAQAHATPATVH